MDRLLTPAELAQMVGLAVQTIYNRLNEGLPLPPLCAHWQAVAVQTVRCSGLDGRAANSWGSWSSGTSPRKWQATP